MNPVRGLLIRLRATHADHMLIARGMAWVVLFAILGKLVGAAKEMAIAWRFGISSEIDSYLFVFNVVSWPAAVWMSVLTVVLVPLLTRLKKESRSEFENFQSELFGFTVLLGGGLALVIWVVLTYVLTTSKTGFSANTTALAIDMIPWLSPVLALGMLISLLSVWIMVAGRHVNTLLEGLPALVLLVVVCSSTKAGIGPLVWGTLLGAGLHTMILLALSGNVQYPRLSQSSPHWVIFWKQFRVMVAGAALIGAIPIIDLFYASTLDNGAVSTLGYANRIVALFMSLGGTAILRATLPVFSATASENKAKSIALAKNWARILFGVGILIVIIASLLSESIVKILFERGAFTQNETQAVVEVLRYGLAQIPFYFAAMALVSHASSTGRYRLLLWSGILAVLLKLMGNSLFVPWLGVSGLALSWSFVYASNAALVWLASRETA